MPDSLALGQDADPSESGPETGPISLGPDADELPMGLDAGPNNLESEHRTPDH